MYTYISIKVKLCTLPCISSRWPYSPFWPLIVHVIYHIICGLTCVFDGGLSIFDGGLIDVDQLWFSPQLLLRSRLLIVRQDGRLGVLPVMGFDPGGSIGEKTDLHLDA